MKRRNLILEFLNEIILLLLSLSCLLSSCSKPIEDIYERTIQVDLTDTTYHLLLHKDGYIYLNDEDIVVGYNGIRYFAATAICPYCMNKGIRFLDLYIVESSAHSYWFCYDCGSSYGESGSCWRGVKLKVYPVTSSGDILTIHL